jgi:hypothetical protein
MPTATADHSPKRVQAATQARAKFLVSTFSLKRTGHRTFTGPLSGTLSNQRNPLNSRKLSSDN